MGQSAAILVIAFGFTIMVGLMLRMSKEDAALQKTFGDQWDDWARRVPYNLMPGVY